MNTVCPKCGSPSARYTKVSKHDLAVKCLCGYLKVVFSTIGTMEILHADTEKNIHLPKEGTFLRKTLMVVSVLEEPSSAEITTRLKELGEEFTVSDVASYLTILRTKGLVEVVHLGRGVAGGSTWRLTDTATALLGI